MKISLKSRELSSIMVNLIVVKMLFTYPRYLVERCQNGAWISVAVYGAVAIGIYYLTQYLYMKTGRKTILEQAQALGGRLFRALTAIILIAVLIMDTAPMVRAFPEAIKTALLQNTQMLDITVILTIGVVFGAYNGIGALGRVSSIFLPVAGISILGFFVILGQFYKLNNIFPLAINQSLTNGVSSLSIYSDIIVVNFLLPYIDDMKTVKRAGLAALVIGVLSSFFITLAYCLVYPFPSSARFISPIYQLARIVKIGTYFQRLEAIFEFVWSISIFLYTSVYLFIMCDIFRFGFGLKHYKPLVFPMMLILLRFVYWEEGYNKTLISNYVVTAVLYPVLYALPLIYGLFYLIKLRRKEKLRQ